MKDWNQLEEELRSLKAAGVTRERILDELEYRENANLDEDYHSFDDDLYGFDMGELEEFANCWDKVFEEELEK